MSDGVRCLGMLSGGLDSIVATRLMLELGLDVTCINVHIPFHPRGTPGRQTAAQRAAEMLGVPLVELDVDEDFLEVIRHPRHGTGKGLNPCIDCRIDQLRRAIPVAEDVGARFIYTGEVLGQRPMSQHRRALGLVAREAGLAGELLRPLSARRLEPTVAEKEGWVDRERLLGIQGRSRQEQMALAAGWGITDYPGPAGGCLLTDGRFVRRLEDLGEHHPRYTLADIAQLKVGRQFRTEDGAKVIVGRNAADNESLRRLELPGLHAQLVSTGGPLVVVLDAADERAETLATLAALVYSSAPDGVEQTLRLWRPGGDDVERRTTPPRDRGALRDDLDRRRL